MKPMTEAQKLAEMSGKDEKTPEQRMNLQRLKIWEKLRKGELHSITKENVAELLKNLESEDQGEVTKDVLQSAIGQIQGLGLSQENISAIAEDADKDHSGRVSEDELFKALTQGDLAFNLIKESLGHQQKAVDEKSLELPRVIAFLNEEYETSTALWSLPQTLVLFFVFVGLMSKHLDLSTAYKMQTALANEIEGEGPPYLHDHEWAIVHDVDTLWQWMSSSFISLHFKEDLSNWPYPGRVAAYNQIIGGVRLTKTDIKEPRLCDQGADLLSLYDTTYGGRCHRSDDGEDLVYRSEIIIYHRRNEDILAHIQNLTNTLWINQNTSYLDVNTLYYNAHLAAFTDCHLTFGLLASGLVKIRLNMETFQADPYFDKRWIVLDAIFALILAKMFYQEFSELLPAFRNGVDGLMNYMELWNLVDWLSIIIGAIVSGYWASISMTVAGPMQDIMNALPTEQLDRIIIQNRTFLTLEQINLVQSHDLIKAQIEELHEVSNRVAESHQFLRTLVFVYSFVLMMKFFKAFQANPRLDIVIRTLTKSAVEIIHFMLVFSVIFLCFSSAGYVIYGSRILGFRDQVEAMFMCWRILMGEFDVEDMQLSSKYLTIIWMVTFQFLVLLILLNMLLAIIMDTYVAAKTEKGDPAQQITVWSQIRLACYTLRETRGHLPLYSLLLQLQDEDYPAHPNNIVTSKSLRRAFQKMTRHQSDYIMRKTVNFIRAEEQECDMSMSDAIRILSYLKVSMLRSVEDTSTILDILKGDQKRSLHERYDAIMADPDAAMSPSPSFSTSKTLPPSTRTLPSTLPASGKMLPLTDGSMMTDNTQSSRGGTAVGVPVSQASRSVATVAAPPMASSAEILQHLARMQENFDKRQGQMIEAMNSRFNEHKVYMEERDNWLDMKVTGVERRCKQVLDASDKLLACMQGVDFSEIPDLLHRMEKCLPAPRSKRLSNTNSANGAVDTGHLLTCPDDTGSLSPTGESEMGAARSFAALSRASHQALVQKVEALSEQVQRILDQADEAAEGRKMLWKIDMGIRQLRQGVPLQQPPQVSDPCIRGGSRPGTFISQSTTHTQATSGQRRLQQDGRHMSAPPGPPPNFSGESWSCWRTDGAPGAPRCMSRSHEESGSSGGGSGMWLPNVPMSPVGSGRIPTSPMQQPPRPTEILPDR